MGGFHHLNRAIEIAAEAHANQNDLAGQPYILHPLRVMLASKHEDGQVVGVLHDVLEDCPEWTLDRLRKIGFSGTQLEALDTITRRDGESYDAYIHRVSRNRLAAEVKRADLSDNMDLQRFQPKTEIDWSRYQKYARASAYLMEPS